MLLALVGLIVAVAGGLVAFWLIGPDDTVYSGEQSLSSKGLAIASTPELLDRHGPVLHVDVRSTKDQPVFVGVARDFDVASYLKGVGHTKLVQVQWPIALATQDEKGTAGPLTAPNTLDWWVAKANGAGTQTLTWPIEDGPYDVVIMNADGNTSPDVRVNLGIEIPNAFTTALAVFAVGIVLLAVGILLMLFRRRPNHPQAIPTQLPHPPEYAPTAQGGGTARRVLAVGLSIGLVSGCAAVPHTDAVAALSRPAVSNQVAADVIKRYDEVSNAANKRRDGKLIATVETGDLLRQTIRVHSTTEQLVGAGGY
ncbi:hypothetical protein [Kribbella shirazensis]|uniref:DUF8094 domain-containing protein n=1 Tax=Kribbella shirazensis TaxID=1105143 RepID=A0A7X6A306_9ACTN|nr:hypothetical protein [Kribbella shirazensis]NIK59480.1 hypothetical protein [Kribbella shirazensis]